MRQYAIQIPAVTGVTSTNPFVQIATPASVSIQILEIQISQESSTTSTATAISIMRRTTASTLPSAGVATATNESDPATSLTLSTTAVATGLATVVGTAGAVVKRWGFNILNGLSYIPVPEARITVKPSSFITLQFVPTPPTATWDGYIIVQEMS